MKKEITNKESPIIDKPLKKSTRNIKAEPILKENVNVSNITIQESPIIDKPLKKSTRNIKAEPIPEEVIQVKDAEIKKSPIIYEPIKISKRNIETKKTVDEKSKKENTIFSLPADTSPLYLTEETPSSETLNLTVKEQNEIAPDDETNDKKIKNMITEAHQNAITLKNKIEQKNKITQTNEPKTKNDENEVKNTTKEKQVENIPKKETNNTTENITPLSNTNNVIQNNGNDKNLPENKKIKESASPKPTPEKVKEDKKEEKKVEKEKPTGTALKWLCGASTLVAVVLLITGVFTPLIGSIITCAFFAGYAFADTIVATSYNINKQILEKTMNRAKLKNEKNETKKRKLTREEKRNIKKRRKQLKEEIKQKKIEALDWEEDEKPGPINKSEVLRYRLRHLKGVKPCIKDFINWRKKNHYPFMNKAYYDSINNKTYKHPNDQALL